jgi:predicted nuclease of predicted toxin-antitoxin system
VLKLLADENFDHDIVRGLIGKNPIIDLLRVQDVGLRGKDDPTILEWAAREQRILLTHDVRTIIPFASKRVESG